MLAGGLPVVFFPAIAVFVVVSAVDAVADANAAFAVCFYLPHVFYAFGFGKLPCFGLIEIEIGTVETV